MTVIKSVCTVPTVDTLKKDMIAIKSVCTVPIVDTFLKRYDSHKKCQPSALILQTLFCDCHKKCLDLVDG